MPNSHSSREYHPRGYSGSTWAFSPERHAVEAGIQGRDFQARLGKSIIARHEAEAKRRSAPPEVLSRYVDGETIIQRRLR